MYAELEVHAAETLQPQRVRLLLVARGLTCVCGCLRVIVLAIILAGEDCSLW